MATFMLFGKYSLDALRGISTKRTVKVNNLIKKFEGKVIASYVLLGENDLVLIVDFPNMEQAMKTSIALSKLTDIAFLTTPAMTVKEFDKMMAKG